MSENELKKESIWSTVMTTKPPAVSPEDVGKIPWLDLAEGLKHLSDVQLSNLYHTLCSCTPM
jgi:hypothetical protein